MPATAQFPGTPGQIAFLASFDGQRRPDIYTIAADGSNLRRLTATPNAVKSGPVWSADGTQLAFHVLSVDGPEVFVMKRDGTGRRSIAPGSNPAWGPDGRLLFESSTACAKGRLLAIATLAGAVTPLTICGSQPAWSPDGSTIAFAAFEEGQSNIDIWTIGADCTQRTQLTTDPADDLAPDWQPVPTCTVRGTRDPDALVGTEGDDVICAGAGNDTVEAGGGADLVYGGRDDDVLSGQDGADTMFGEQGNDVLGGGAAFDTLDGGSGTDTCDPGGQGASRRLCEL